MYLRLVRFTLSEEGRARAQAMAGDLIPVIKQQPGCVSAAFFGGGEDGDSGVCVFWDSQEHANAAAAVIRPMLDQHLAGTSALRPTLDCLPCSRAETGRHLRHEQRVEVRAAFPAECTTKRGS